MDGCVVGSYLGYGLYLPRPNDVTEISVHEVRYNVNIFELPRPTRFDDILQSYQLFQNSRGVRPGRVSIRCVVTKLVGLCWAVETSS